MVSLAVHCQESTLYTSQSSCDTEETEEDGRNLEEWQEARWVVMERRKLELPNLEKSEKPCTMMNSHFDIHSMKKVLREKSALRKSTGAFYVRSERLRTGK